MKNFIYDDGREMVLNKNDYNCQIIKCLEKILPNFKKYLFILYGNNSGDKLPISRNFQHNKKILIWVSGENKQQQFDKIKSDYLYIFSHYSWSRSNIYSIPLGYFSNDEDKDIIPMSERLFDIFFIGCLNRNRMELASILSGIDKKWISLGMTHFKHSTLKILNGLIQWKHNTDYYSFNGDFNKGIDQDKYLFILRNSKIVLCPKGWVNAETFRLYEALKFGCGVISDILPDRDYYKDIPIIQTNDWNNSIITAKSLLKNEEKLIKIGGKNQKFYENNLSPMVVANKIKTIIL